MLGAPSNLPPLLIIIIGLWTLFWKGLVLWRSARNSQKYWFLALLLMNTLGIFDIIYLAFFQKDKNPKKLQK